MPVVEFQSQLYNWGLRFWAFGFCICGLFTSYGRPCRKLWGHSRIGPSKASGREGAQNNTVILETMGLW